ncbi:SMP-30/gluconolactonase/LRE family protein [Phenylobacterium deserti]|uniref:SMP-30/gluconolactonase/LRE family protein n=1 Tax=Phenylobacterium deserti TaxID=1914756 RepID=A0A328A887_9CAUL|nr:SMP-30/gluconolactonase/LRE family protein [Phenylobacterium deserti]RAK50772.1 SMP-30/gluconolactonase/LRE family protein [Phenylobacterium deserti]
MSKSLIVTCSAVAALAVGWAPSGATQSQPPAASTASEIKRLDPALDRVIAPGARVEKVATGFQFTEGPMWRDGRLWFSDLVGNQLVAVTPQGQTQVLLDKAGGLQDPPAGSYLGSNGLVTGPDGAVLMTQHGARRIVRLDERFSAAPVIERFEGKRLNSPNDLVFTADGALWFTDPPFGLAKGDEDPGKEVAFNGVYRWHDGKLTAPIRDLPRPNGLAFSPDGRTLYVANSGPEMFIRAYPVTAAGAVGQGRLFASFAASEGAGVPDGVKVDSAGNVWATGPGGVHVFAPSGRKLGLVALPEVAANLGWADGGRTLYITGSTSIYRLGVATPGIMPRYTR